MQVGEGEVPKVGDLRGGVAEQLRCREVVFVARRSSLQGGGLRCRGRGEEGGGWGGGVCCR